MTMSSLHRLLRGMGYTCVRCLGSREAPMASVASWGSVGAQSTQGPWSHTWHRESGEAVPGPRPPPAPGSSPDVGPRQMQGTPALPTSLTLRGPPVGWYAPNFLSFLESCKV